MGDGCYLGDEEAGVAFREPASLTGQDHLQHVSMELLHDHKHVLHRLKHPLQQDHAQVGQILDTHTHTLDDTADDVMMTSECGSLSTCRMATSFLSCVSCLAGKRVLSMTLMATGRPDIL